MLDDDLVLFYDVAQKHIHFVGFLGDERRDVVPASTQRHDLVKAETPLCRIQLFFKFLGKERGGSLPKSCTDGRHPIEHVCDALMGPVSIEYLQDTHFVECGDALGQLIEALQVESVL